MAAGDDARFLFSFEKLRAYQAAERALGQVCAVREQLKGAPGELRSQLERALVSLCLNLAEGTGRKSVADRARVYQLAFGSGSEAMSALRILRALSFGSPALTQIELSVREASMLTFHLLRSTTGREA